MAVFLIQMLLPVNGQAARDGEERTVGIADWLRDRSLTLVLLGLFAICLVGQVLTGWYEFNEAQTEHGLQAISLSAYFAVGHPWEALFENWESEFLQMAAFVTFTTFLYQKGSPESRRPGVVELVDADPRPSRTSRTSRGRSGAADGSSPSISTHSGSRCLAVRSVLGGTRLWRLG